MNNTSNKTGVKKPADGFFEYVSKQDLLDFRAGKKKEKGKFNLTISPGFAINGGFWSLDINAEAFDALQKIEIGGKLLFKVRNAQKAPSPKTGSIKPLANDSVDEL